MTSGERANAFGAAGCGILTTCWLLIYLAPYVIPPGWVPGLWLVVVVVFIPSAIVAGFVAARRSRWWHCLTAAAIASAAMLVASVA